jgi:hypothetical protein
MYAAVFQRLASHAAAVGAAAWVAHWRFSDPHMQELKVWSSLIPTATLLEHAL